MKTTVIRDRLSVIGDRRSAKGAQDAGPRTQDAACPASSFQLPVSSLGFSILEMASVLAILILIIGAATGAFLGWQHAAAVSGAEDQIHAALSHTRQFAITRRTPTGLTLGVTNAPGYPSRVYFYAFTNAVDDTDTDSAAAAARDLDLDRAVAVSEVSYLPLRSSVTVSNDWLKTAAKDGPFVIRFLADGRTQPDLDSDPAVVVVGVTRNGNLTSRTLRLNPLTGLPHSVRGEP